MEKEYVIQVAQIIKEQLVALTPMTVLMSWSIEEFAATLYRDLPALRIKVNGRLHAGYVIVVLNGSDYYEVYLVKGMDVECVTTRFVSMNWAVSSTGLSKAVRTKPSMINSVNRSDRIYM